MAAVVYFTPLLFLFTAITSSWGGDRLTLWLVLAFAAWGIGFPAACIYHDHYTDMVNQAEWKEASE